MKEMKEVIQKEKIRKEKKHILNNIQFYIFD